MTRKRQKALAYIVGVALGDGNLSNPNGRAIRLRVTCDAKYPRLAKYIITNLKLVFPHNKVGVTYIPNRDTYFNISVYSNTLAELLSWQVGKGTKEQQGARVPVWVRRDTILTKECLRGLLQTDGSIYRDRGYLMVNFTNHTRVLAEDVSAMLVTIGFKPTLSKTASRNGTKYTVRVARNSQKLIKTLDLFKA